jgi:hypothetical protein
MRTLDSPVLAPAGHLHARPKQASALEVDQGSRKAKDGKAKDDDE